MKLVELSIQNYRSIKTIDNFIVTSFQSILGENNSGKSNIFSSIEAFLSAGSGGTKPEDFNDKSQTIIIKTKFKINSPVLKKTWKPYLLNDELILEKHNGLKLIQSQKKKQLKMNFTDTKQNQKNGFFPKKKLKNQKEIDLNGKKLLKKTTCLTTF